MEDVLAFLQAFTEAERRAMHASFAEPDDQKFLALVWAWDEMFGGSLESGLSRLMDQPASAYASEKKLAAAARQQARPVFALARYLHDGNSLYRAWLGHEEPGPRGEGMFQNLYITGDPDKLKVVSVYRICVSCLGSCVADGEPCVGCDGSGWVYRRGVEWPPLGAPLEVRKLMAPTDPRYDAAYQAIPSPESE